MPREFLAVAFDSGGVASGPMTAAFLLLLAIANQGYTGSIMDAARAEGAGVIVFSLPVTDTAGLRLLEEDEPVNP